MVSGNVLIGLGIALLLVAVLAVRSLIPRDGEPASAWVRTEFRATSTTIGLMTLMIFGAALLIRGLVS